MSIKMPIKRKNPIMKLAGVNKMRKQCHCKKGHNAVEFRVACFVLMRRLIDDDQINGSNAM